MAVKKLASPPYHLISKVKDDRASEVLDALCVVYPGSISAEQLMRRVDPSWQTNRVISFASICNQFIKINRVLKVKGWQAKRTNGTPYASYWLSPLGGG
ncbi:hypothetical protein O8B39_17455 [Agrobacterium rhizogenes]|nr:hypothetical protein [Rhizobium rhizogenes]